jgi:hypothetical protein
MPNLAQHQSNNLVKLLLVGDAKSGKTSSLVSLVEADYQLRILDMDNLLDPLKYQVLARCPKKIGNVEFRTLRDKRKMTPTGPMIDGPPRAFIDAIRMFDHWKYDDVDLGRPADWGDNAILVVDSLSRLCDAAFDWRETLTPRGRSGEYDKRATYADAQNAVEDVLAGLTSPLFQTNLIVIGHGQYQPQVIGPDKIFPQGIGQKLSPRIPAYFPNYIRYINRGGRRTIQLESDPQIDLATAKPLELKSLPTETGLATLFEALREVPSTIKPKPTLIRKA